MLASPTWIAARLKSGTLNKPRSGVRMSFTRDVMTAPNAAPMTTPMARSTTFPRRMNLRKSLMPVPPRRGPTSPLSLSDGHPASVPVADSGRRPDGAGDGTLRRPNQEVALTLTQELTDIQKEIVATVRDFVDKDVIPVA